MLKALDIIVSLWLIGLFNVAWRTGTVPINWWTGGVVPIFKKETVGCVPITGVSHCYAFLRKPMAGYWKRGSVKPRIQEEQCRFHPGYGTVKKLFTLARLF